MQLKFGIFHVPEIFLKCLDKNKNPKKIVTENRQKQMKCSPNNQYFYYTSIDVSRYKILFSGTTHVILFSDLTIQKWNFFDNVSIPRICLITFGSIFFSNHPTIWHSILCLAQWRTENWYVHQYLLRVIYAWAILIRNSRNCHKDIENKM